MLRRRPLSSDLTLSATWAADAAADARPPAADHVPLRAHPPLARTLTPEPYLRTCARAHAAARTHPSPIPGPNIFVQPHAPVLASPAHFPPLTHTLSLSAQCSPIRGDYMPLPQFTFDQSEAVYMSGLSAGIPDADAANCPSSPFDSRLEDRAGFSAKNRRTAQ